MTTRPTKSGESWRTGTPTRRSAWPRISSTPRWATSPTIWSNSRRRCRCRMASSWWRGASFPYRRNRSGRSWQDFNEDGSLDPGFDPGTGPGTGVNLSSDSFDVFCLALQPDGKLLAGGDFPGFDGFPVDNLVRLFGGDRVTPMAPRFLSLLPPRRRASLSNCGSAPPADKRWSSKPAPTSSQEAGFRLRPTRPPATSSRSTTRQPD